MLQGQLVRIAILLQQKHPILIRVQDQDITRRAGTPTDFFFFCSKLFIHKLMQRGFVSRRELQNDVSLR